MNPLFNRSGYILESHELRVLQKDGWLSLPLNEIAEVKTKLSFTEVIIRLADGRKKILNLSHLGTRAFSEVRDALNKAQDEYRQRTRDERKAKEPFQTPQTTRTFGPSV